MSELRVLEACVGVWILLTSLWMLWILAMFSSIFRAFRDSLKIHELHEERFQYLTQWVRNIERAKKDRSEK
jgi:hypothetical protein